MAYPQHERLEGAGVTDGKFMSYIYCMFSSSLYGRSLCPDKKWKKSIKWEILQIFWYNIFHFSPQQICCSAGEDESGTKHNYMPSKSL